MGLSGLEESEIEDVKGEEGEEREERERKNANMRRWPLGWGPGASWVNRHNSAFPFGNGHMGSHHHIEFWIYCKSQILSGGGGGDGGGGFITFFSMCKEEEKYESK